MTKDQADELKRLIRAVRDAEHRGTLANETFYATQAEKAAAAYIDSLTQQPAEPIFPMEADRLRRLGFDEGRAYQKNVYGQSGEQPAELTADELEKAIRDQRSALKALGLELTEVGIARTGIAAHKEKVKV